MATKQELIQTVNNMDQKILALAKTEFEKHGLVDDDTFAFSRVVYEQVADYLLQFLSDRGFEGNLGCAGCFVENFGNAYAIYDKRLYSRDEVIEILKNRFFNYSVDTSDESQ